MADNLETDIRKALDAKAHEVDVPSDLATRTIAKAIEGRKRAGMRERFRAFRDAWRLRVPVTGYPRWLYAGLAGATAVLLFFVGSAVTNNPVSVDQPVVGYAERCRGRRRGAPSAPSVVMDAPMEVQLTPAPRSSRSPSGGASAHRRRAVAPDIAPVPLHQQAGKSLRRSAGRRASSRFAASIAPGTERARLPPNTAASSRAPTPSISRQARSRNARHPRAVHEARCGNARSAGLGNSSA